MKRSLLTIAVLVAGAGAAFGQGPVRLSLEDAVARGLEASHRLEEMSARHDAARAAQAQRAAASRPQIAAIASYTRTNHVEEFSVPSASGGSMLIFPDIPDNVRSRIDLQWPIYTGGRLSALTRAAGADADATEQDREVARADLKLEITRAFWAAVTARASLAVVRQTLERTRAHLNDVTNQLSVGLVPPSDVLSTEAQHARQRLLTIEAESLVETTSADIKRLVGLDQDATLELLDNSAVEVTASSPAAITGATIDQVRAARPERRSLLFRISAAGDREAAASAGRLPLLTAIGGYDMARPNRTIFPIQEKWTPSWDAGIQFRWFLFDGGRVRAEIAEADANRRATQARLRDFDAIVEVEVRQRTAELASASASIEAAGAGVRAAAEASRVIAERFAAGVATNTDVLSAQSALLQAELDLTRARANAQLATARLDRALGR